MHYSCLLAVLLAAVVLARPPPMDVGFEARRPNGRFGSDSLDGDYQRSGDYSPLRGAEGYARPGDETNTLQADPDYSDNRYPSQRPGGRLTGAEDSFAQGGRGMPATDLQSLGDDRQPESYPNSRDSLPINRGHYKRDGGNSFMGLDGLMSLGGSVAQEGKSILGGFPGLGDDEQAARYPSSSDSLPTVHENYKRDGGNSLMGLGSLISLGNSFSDLPGLGNDEKDQAYPTQMGSSMGRHYSKRDGENSFMGLDSLMSLGDSLAQKGKSVLGGFPGLADGEEMEGYPSPQNSYKGTTYQKRALPFGVMGDSKMGLSGISGLGGLGDNFLGSGESRRPNGLGDEMTGPDAAQDRNYVGGGMTGAGRRGGRLGNGIAGSTGDSYRHADQEDTRTRDW